MATDAGIRAILDPGYLTSQYVQRSPDFPTPLADAFFVNPENVPGSEYDLFFDPADSDVAPANQVGSEARVLTLGDAQERKAAMFYVFNKIPFGEDVLNALREPDSYTLQNKGRVEVGRRMTKFVNRHRRFKELVIAKSLVDGVVYLNKAGDVLESSSGAVYTCDLGVAATHKGTLDSLITAMFSAATTDIPSILESIDDAAESANVPPPTDVWVNKLNLGDLRNNDYFVEWAANNESASSRVLQGGMIENLWGKTWHFIGTKYKAADGTMKPYIPVTGQGSLILTPKPGDPWMKAVNGSSLVPKSLEIVTDVESALNNLDEIYGQFMYAKIKDDPVNAWAYAGDKFGFNFNDPNAIWTGDAFA